MFFFLLTVLNWIFFKVIWNNQTIRQIFTKRNYTYYRIIIGKLRFLPNYYVSQKTLFTNATSLFLRILADIFNYKNTRARDVCSVEVLEMLILMNDARFEKESGKRERETIIIKVVSSSSIHIYNRNRKKRTLYLYILSFSFSFLSLFGRMGVVL